MELDVIFWLFMLHSLSNIEHVQICECLFFEAHNIWFQEPSGRLGPGGADWQGAQRAHGLIAVDWPDVGPAPQEGRGGRQGSVRLTFKSSLSDSNSDSTNFDQV